MRIDWQPKNSSGELAASKLPGERREREREPFGKMSKEGKKKLRKTETTPTNRNQQTIEFVKQHSAGRRHSPVDGTGLPFERHLLMRMIDHWSAVACSAHQGRLNVFNRHPIGRLRTQSRLRVILSNSNRIMDRQGLARRSVDDRKEKEEN